MDKMEITWGITLKVWWSFIWRCIVFSAVLGFILGFVGGVILVLVGEGESSALVGGILGYLGSIPVSIWAMKKILGMEFNGFSIAIVPIEEVETI